MGEARRLAAEYRLATGKSLPITGEIAVHDALRLLGLDEAPAELAGVDALRQVGPDLDDSAQKIQVKGRAIFDQVKGGHRLGQLRTEQAWDVLVLVLMDEHYETTEIYAADKDVIVEVLDRSNKQRQRRGAVSVARFKIIGELLWSRDLGLSDDGYWTNRVSG